MKENDYYDKYQLIDEVDNRGMAMPAVMRKVYTWMTMALAITGITAYGVAISPNLLAAIFSNSGVFFGLIIAELALVFILSARVHKLSLTTATTMFILYSVLNGVVLSSIFVIYSATSIATTFFVCAGTFGAMSLYGITTKKDLSGLGKILMMGLIGLIIALVVNIFLRNSMFDLVLSAIGVVLFTALTAWDTQKIKVILSQYEYADETAQKMGILCALTLYLDFVNLFLYLLRFLGNNKE